MPVKKSYKNILWGYAFLLLVLAYIFGLFIDLTGDSGLYAAIARQMVESHDWLTLKINKELYDQKPHLLFWLAGLGIKIFGNTNFAFKIFPTLWALAGVYFTYRLGKLLYSKTAGKYAALIAGTSQVFVLYLLDIHTDTVLQTGVILALWQLTAFLKSGTPIHFFWGFVGVGLAMLAKGPVGAVIPFFMVFIYLIARKDYRHIFHPKWFFGIIIAFIVVSPSLVHLYKSFGTEGIRFFFITNNFGRISGEYAGSSNDPFFYLYNSLWIFLPWTVFVVFAVFSEIKSWFSKKKSDVWGIALLGSVLIFTVILSIAKGKSPNYFLMAVFPIAVLTGRWMAQNVSSSTKTEKSVQGFQWAVIGIILLVFGLALFINQGNNGWLPIALILFFLIAVIFAFRFQNKKSLRVILVSFVLAGTLSLFLNVSVIPHLYDYQGARQVVRIYQQNRNENDKLYNFDLEEYELFFMAKDSVGNIDTWEKLFEVLERPGSWVYTNSTKFEEISHLEYKTDTAFVIRQHGMNHLNGRFLNPATRESNLKTNYLIRISGK
ncbi:hypothetical protein GM418_06140 [Maribellus comscasis]|uniref:Glycosyltransferase RgtA/B/C/D-like domain-containing protein n=1 Tax=Maribellus comscasis TaxID=2681766 RepID=A0A6I6JSW9_9BACT|nr:glycosyltransferase family 39 protein [Maribellus comscasis]QGY43252.1 hypothetical protein GM418_06140 [Maribellus comscasis]